MRDPIHVLTLGIDKRRGDETPVPVLGKIWYDPDLPSRAEFMAAIEEAYESIELPFFPSSAWVMIATATRTKRIEASEPEDQEMVAAGLWTAIVTAAAGYG